MAAKSTRLLLENEGIMTDVAVYDVHQVSADLLVVSVLVGGVRYDDIYNVEKDILEVVLQARAGKNVVITIEQDSVADYDQHPSITRAEIVE